MRLYEKLTSRNIFLFDGIGALASAILLGHVLVRFQSYIGMPTRILIILAILALVFALYSFTIHALKPKKWTSFLRIIAITNLAYCLLTLILTMIYFDSLSCLGISYFIIEIIVILTLVRIEFSVMQSGGTQIT
ncbi:hypothetical protein [Ekhidna sp.]|uniref:hypothetical protein n=1 Tax=Ekhidna sp. TaxID=2608089 RepID=UPI0032996B72